MKIFSLELKTNLVGWSVFLGLLANWIAGYSHRIMYQCAIPIIQGVPQYSNCPPNQYGWPIQVKTYISFSHFMNLGNLAEWGNIFFWVVVFFIILNIVNYFKKESVKIATNL